MYELHYDNVVKKGLVHLCNVMYTKYSLNLYKAKKERKNEKEQKNVIFKQEDMQAQTPRKESTMAPRFLETPKISSQKGKNPHSSPTRKNCLSPPRSDRSPLTQSPSAFSHTQRSCSPSRRPSEMTIIVTSAFRKWLTDHGLQGFIQVAEAPPHPNALEMASKFKWRVAHLPERKEAQAHHQTVLHSTVPSPHFACARNAARKTST